MKNSRYIIFFLIFSCLSLYGQKEWNNWYFGENAGITFNTPDGIPIALTDGQLYSEEGCTTISDKSGILLFYSDGRTIYNKSHLILPNGGGLSGDNNSTQSSIIISKPGSKNIFYLITTDAGIGLNGCRYSEIDLNLDGGLGNINTNKDILLFNSSTEKLTAIRHSNGIDWWIIGHEWDSDVFRCYLVTKSGINLSPVQSIAGLPHTDKKGYLKASRYGNKLALAVTGSGIVELFNFDNSKGIVDSKSILLNSSSSQSFYGIEFSPDGSKLYASRLDPTSAIIQYDLNEPSFNQTIIAEKKENYSYGALQLGPDYRIYVAKIGNKCLGRINYPDSSGLACKYVDSSVSLNNMICRNGLPNNYSRDLLKIQIKTNAPLCVGDSLFLECEKIFGATYNWNGPGNFSSQINNPSIFIKSDNIKGFYKVTLSLGGMVISDSIYIDISLKPDFEITGYDTTTLCPGDSLILKLSSMDNTLKYQWSTGEKTIEKVVKVPGIYSVTAVNLAGCKTTKKIEVKFFDFSTKIKALGPTELCNGDSVILTVEPYKPDYKLQWTTGENSPSIVIKKSQFVGLSVENPQGCKIYDSTNIVVFDKLNVKIENNISPPYCIGDTIELSTNLTSNELNYYWSTGERTPKIRISKPGYYSVKVSLNNGCTDSTNFWATFIDRPDISVVPDKNTSICTGDFVDLTAQSKYSGVLKYYWNTGDTTKSIRVFSMGKYQVQVENEFGCRDSSFINIFVLARPVAKIQPDGSTILCEGDVVKLSASPQNINYKYLWSTGETTTDIFVNKTDTYKLIIQNENGCLDSTEIIIVVNPKPIVEIISNGPNQLCEGSSIVLKTKEKYQSYQWSTGEIQDSIIIDTSGSYWVKSIDSNGCTGISNKINISVSDIKIDGIGSINNSKFDNVCIGSALTKSIIFTNTNLFPITIDRISYYNNEAFDIKTDPALPHIFDNDSSLTIKITFLPKLIKNYYDTLNFHIVSPCLKDFNLPFSGNGVAEVLLSIPDTTLPFSFKYCIPINIKLRCGDSIKQKIHYKGTVKLDATMFYPDETLSEGIISTYMIDGERFFEIESDIDSLTLNQGTLLKICGIILYGKYEWIKINLGEFLWNNSNILSISQDGELDTYGVCALDISHIRLFELTKMIIENKDNSLIANIETGESGVYNFSIYNLQGIRVYNDFWYKSDNNKSKNEILINEQGLTPGLYIINLTAPSGIISKKFIKN